jgi:hypothetical protein
MRLLKRELVEMLVTARNNRVLDIFLEKKITLNWPPFCGDKILTEKSQEHAFYVYYF